MFNFLTYWDFHEKNFMAIIPLQRSSRSLVVINLVFKLVELKTNLVALENNIIYSHSNDNGFNFDSN